MLRGKRIELKLVERDDLKYMIEWRATTEAYRAFFTYTPLNIDLQIEWYERQLHDEREQNFIIWHLESNLPIGMISLVDIDYKSGRAEWGRVIIGAPDMMRRGYGQEAIELIMKYAFGHLNLRRLSCTALANNAHVIGLYEKLGFKQEGTLRKYVYKDGKYLDVILFSILNEEYRERQ